MSINKTTESINDFNRALVTANLSPELQEFVKIFPPPYRYYGGRVVSIGGGDVLEVSTRFYVNNSHSEIKFSVAFGNLICNLLNKHFEGVQQ